jgi:Tfp pilus assembly protein PilN
MIRVNLLKSGPQRQITIPFGWIFVAAFAVLVCAFLFVVDQQHKAKIEEKNADLEKVQQTVLRLKKHWTVRKQLKEQHRSLERDHSRYTSLLGQKGAGWTPTLLLFEELLQRAQTVWFRDLRIDGDGRVMINGVSMENKRKKRMPGIVTLYKEISDRRTKFKSVRLKRIQKSKEQRQDVSQFELNCVLIR